MKTTKHIILLFASVFFAYSCELKDFSPEEWAVTPELQLSESGIVASSLSETHEVSVVTNYQEFTVSSNQSWCSVNADQTGRTITIHVDNNEGADQRTAIVTVTVERGNRTLSKDVAIYQVGGKWDVIDGTDIKLRWAYDISESQKDIIKRQLKQLVWVEGGTFLMGAQKEDQSALNYSKYATTDNPVHKVTLSSFYIAKYEVTQEQWAAVMGTSPSRFIGGNKPVENISWEEALDYVTQLANLTGLKIKLPTSAQWEYAARGGQYSMGFEYAGSDSLTNIAHGISSFTVMDNSPLYTTMDVGSKDSNELGLYDMTGNVSEFCSDWYGAIPSTEQTDPVGPNDGKYHVIRGGDFSNSLLLSTYGAVHYVASYMSTSKTKEAKTSFTGLRIVYIK